MMNPEHETRFGQTFRVPYVNDEFFERPALVPAQLSKLILVRAPGGYGKTTAVAHWAQAQTLSQADVVWVRGALVERTRVWEVLCDALSQALHAEDPTALERIQSAGVLAGRPDIRAKQLASAFQRETILVLDNYEGLTQSDLDIGLADLVRQSALLTLVIVSRRFAVLDTSLMFASLSTQMLTEKELTLQAEDIHEFAAHYGKLTPDALALLVETTGGWPLAVSALLSSLRVDGSAAGASRRIEAGDISASLSLLAESFLARIGEDPLRRAFLAIVVCDDISVSTLREAVSIFSDADLPASHIEISVSRLESLGMIIKSVASGVNRYRAHLQIGRVFRKRAVQEFSHSELQHLLRIHANDLSVAQPLDAVVLYVEISDYSAAEKVLGANLATDTVTHEGLREALQRLPFAYIAGYPALSTSSLVLAMMNPSCSDCQVREMVEQFYEAAEKGVSKPNASTTDFARLALAQSFIGKHRESLELSRERFREESAIPLQAVLSLGPTLPFRQSRLGFNAALQGDLTFARAAYGRALEYAELLGDVSEKARALYGLAFCGYLLGEFRSAKVLAKRARRLNASWDREGIQQLVFEVAPVRAMLAAQKADVDEFQRVYDACWPLRHRLESWPTIVLAESYLQRLLTGDTRTLDLLHSHLEQEQSVVAVSDFLAGSIAAQISKLHVLQGSFVDARDQATSLCHDDPESRLIETQISVVMGDMVAASQTIDSLSMSLMTDSQHSEYLLYSAIVSLVNGDTDVAMHDYLRSARIMRRLGNFSALTLVPYSQLVELASLANAAGEKGLLNKVRRMPERIRGQGFEPLSNAETRTLEALASVDSLDQIATALFISSNTLKFHLRNIYKKLRVSSREGAVHRAVRMGLTSDSNS